MADSAARFGTASPPMSHADIRQRLARIPRVKLALTPTPIEEAPNLSRALGGPRIFIKRDDLTGVAFGGNKLRNLEFRLARAMSDNPDTVVVGLDIQSNSARQTIGACNKLGLKTILVLEGDRPEIIQGNLLVDYLLGAEVIFAPTRNAQRVMLDEQAARVRASGGRISMLRGYHIFNFNQVDDLPEQLIAVLPDPETKDERGDAFIRAPKAEVRHAGTEACLIPMLDIIQMPRSAHSRPRRRNGAPTRMS